MKYADGVDEFLARYHKVMPSDFFDRPVSEQRQLYLNLSEAFPYPVPDNVAIRDHTLSSGGRDLTFRAYLPKDPAGPGVIVYFHGGGFVVGSLESHHTLVAELAANTGMTTIAADFPAAPENPFPAAPEECYALLCALRDNPDVLGVPADTEAPVLCGDSSGANLSVVLSLMCRDRGGPRPKGQGLIGPVLDFARWYDLKDDSGFAEEMQYYARAYCPDAASAASPYVSPLVSAEFHGLPPAYIMSTELDDLQEDAVNYTARLEHAGIPVQLVIEPGLVHAPVRGRSVIPQVADAWRRFCSAVKVMAAA